MSSERQILMVVQGGTTDAGRGRSSCWGCEGRGFRVASRLRNVSVDDGDVRYAVRVCPECLGSPLLAA